jgi:osmoprotectant transport system substrate-binding protein
MKGNFIRSSNVAASCLGTILLVMWVAFGYVGCSSSKPGTLVIGSKGFPEQEILFDIVSKRIATALSLKTREVTLKNDTRALHRQLVDGQIDCYPEYTGTALTEILGQDPISDPAVVLETVRHQYREKAWNVEWLAPLGFDDRFAVVMRPEDAAQRGIKTLSDAAKVPWILGVNKEFLYRKDGLEGLVKRYGLVLKRPPEIPAMDALYKSLVEKQVDMIVVNSTDGLLQVVKPTVLTDDKEYFSAYQASLVCRTSVLDSHPGLRETLNSLSGKFSNTTMQGLNYKVEVLKETTDQVAAEFLTSTFPNPNTH